MGTNQTLDKLRMLLEQCTALVRVDGQPRGTAFFFTNHQLLTCRHVVKDEAEVTVEPYRRNARQAAVVPAGRQPGLDLALLEVRPDPGEPPQPCVLLATQLGEAEYYVAGYPREEGQEAGLEVFKLQGHPRLANDGLAQQLQLEAGKQVTWGMSGGPVLNTTAAAVTAVVQSSKDPVGALGGGAIPISKAAEAFEQVRKALSDPPLAVRQWRDALGKNVWQQLGRPWDMHVQVDLWVRGSRNGWRITTEPAVAPEQAITLKDLGDELTEAMFRWAQRRRVSAIEEVELLGRLLARALFPGDLAERLKVLSNADEVLVRLHIAPENEIAAENELVDIPWELAAVPNQKGRFLAADDRFRFSRIVDGARPAVEPSVESRRLRVLGVVGLPKWKYPTIYRQQRPYPSPSADIAQAELSKHVTGAGLDLELLTNPQPYDIRNKIRDEPFDILHYVGIGQVTAKNKVEISMVDPGNAQDASWADIGDLLAPAAEHGIRLVVLEFTIPPPERVSEPVTPSALGDLLHGSIDAVLYTRFPVHYKQYSHFNIKLYSELGKGNSVETAVQVARQALQQNKAIEDAAGFGWFTLVTGPRSDIRLMRQIGRSPRETGTPRSASTDRSASPVPTFVGSNELQYRG